MLRSAHHGVGQGNYEAFCTWAAELAASEDRLDVRDLFPYSKRLDHLRLSAMDTTERTTVQSSNARLSWDDAARVIDAAEPGTRHVLAIHNVPFEGRASLAESIKGYAGGYSSGDMERMKLFATDARLEAVVCGHVHATDEYQLKLGDCVPVYLMGRTGGVHGTVPAFGVLAVPAQGQLRWTEREV